MRRILHLWPYMAILGLICAPAARAQNGRYDNDVKRFTVTGAIPAPGATITVCQVGATVTYTNTTLAPSCSPLATIYTSATSTTPAANPFQADAQGNFGFWGVPGQYVVTEAGQNLAGYTLNVNLSCVPGNGAQCGAFTNAANIWSAAQNFTAPIQAKNVEAIRYVDATNSQGWAGSDGGAWIASAIADLPSCSMPHYFYNTYSSLTWTHCGVVKIANGAYTVSSPISITSPFLTVEGAGPTATTLNYAGANGGAISWTASPFGDEFIGMGGLYNLTIDGYSAGAGTYGLTTNDISGFHMHGVVIQNFTGANSIGWLDSTTSWYNEKFDVECTLKNNAISWQINPAVGSPGYPSTTFGYGTFDVKINTFSGQVGMQMVNGALQFSLVHMTINQVSTPANADAIQLQGTSTFSLNTGSLEIESPQGIGTGHHEINATSNATVPFGLIGPVVQDLMESNVWSAGTPANLYLSPADGLTWPIFKTSGSNPAGTANTVFRIDPNAPGQTRQNIIDVTAIANAAYQHIQFPNPGGDDVMVARTTNDTFTGTKTFASGKLVAISPTLNGTSITGTPASGNLSATIASGTATMTTALIAAGACGTTVTVAASGVVTTDTISVANNAAVGANPGVLILNKWPTAGNVNFNYCNPTAAGVTPSAATLNWSVWR